MNKVVRKRRLLHLIETLLHVPEERFNMNYWAHQDDKTPVGCKVGLSCGAAACALGWEASTPYARKAGLKLIDVGNGEAEVIYKNEDCEGDEAGMKFFGITCRESEYLFGPWTYTGEDGDSLDSEDIKPHMVIARVAELYRKYANE